MSRFHQGNSTSRATPMHQPASQPTATLVATLGLGLALGATDTLAAATNRAGGHTRAEGHAEAGVGSRCSPGPGKSDPPSTTSQVRHQASQRGFLCTSRRAGKLPARTRRGPRRAARRTTGSGPRGGRRAAPRASSKYYEPHQNIVGEPRLELGARK